MEHICSRCTRLGFRIRSGGTPLPLPLPGARGFSTSRISYDEGEEKPQGKPLQGTPLHTVLQDKATPSRRPKLVFRKQLTGSGRISPAGTTTPATGVRQPPGPVLRRTGAAATQSTGAGSRLDTGSARAGSGHGTGSRTPPPGLLLRRSGPPRTGASDSRTQGRPGATQAQGPQRRIDRRIRRASERKESEAADEEEDDDDDRAAKVENYINTIVDPPPNPTEELPYVPGQNMSHSDLRMDWPPTPLSSAGLTESVQQRIEWLAHRIPHGYHTPMQLAERYSKGYFTRFESKEEKEKVLELASQLAREKADKYTEKKGEEVQPEDMAFEGVASRKVERDGLADRYVRGKYPVVEKQKMPFLDQIVRNLNNNGTYQTAKTEMFMQTVQKLMGNQGQGQSGQPAQKQKAL